MAVNSKIAAIISAAYDRLAEMSVQIIRNFDDGYGQSKAQDILRLRVIKTTKALRLILKFVEFDEEGDFVEVHRISNARINALLTYVTKVADVKNLPSAPKLFYRSTGNIIQGSTPASPLNGSLANGHILVGDATNNAIARQPSGVIAMTNTGVFSFVAGSIVNADINASAAIAYSKLSLTGAIVNADVSAVAGIAYSKLSLTGGIVNADVNAAAAIAYSKLSLTGGIVNADVNAAAAIAYSKLNLIGGIVNADVNAAAAIARTKTASGTAYRIVANNSLGVMSENAALSASLAIVSDANGQLTTVAGVTTTRMGYLATLSSDVQTQLGTKLTATLTGSATGDTLYYSGGVYINLAIGAPGTVMTVSGGGIPSWGAPTANGLPTGGTAAQFLTKVDGVDYNATWTSLTLALVTDVTATAAEINVLQGITASTTQLNYLTGVTSSIQNQLDGKQSSTLAQNSIWVGNGSNLATAISAGTNGYVLTITSGVPTWEPAAAAGTPPGANTQVIFNDAGSFGADSVFVWDKTNNYLGVGYATPTATVHIRGANNLVALLVEDNAGNSIIKAEETGGALQVDIIDTYRFNTSTITNISAGPFVITASAGNLQLNSGPTGSLILSAQDEISLSTDNNINIGSLLGSVSIVAGVDISLTPSGNLLLFNIANDNTETKLLTWNSGDNKVEYRTVASLPGTISGLTTNRIPYATSATTLGDDSALTWDSTNNALTVGDTVLHSTGSNNLFVGASSGNFTIGAAVDNTGLGDFTLTALTTGDRNVAVGTGALNDITTTSENTAIGSRALEVALGSSNTALGSAAGDNVTTANSTIIIGALIDAQSATVDGQLSIGNAIFGSGNTTTGTTVASGNIGFYATTWGTSAAKVISVGTGTAPSTSITDGFQMYSADIAAGNAAAHFRTENGGVIKLYRDTGWTLITGTPSKAGFATSTATLTQVAESLKAIMDHLQTNTGFFGT